jgi:hypothetical protein
MVLVWKGGHRITYSQLYAENLNDVSGGARTSTISKIVDNVYLLSGVYDRGACDNNFSVKAKLVGAGKALTLIETELNAAWPETPIVLGKLFYSDSRGRNTLEEELLDNTFDRLENVHRSRDDEMYHFCLPFLMFQKLGAKAATETFLDKFIHALGTKTMNDFYANTYTLDERYAAAAALHLGLLKERRDLLSKPNCFVAAGSEVGPGTDSNGKDLILESGGNGRRCEGGVCVPSIEEHWCSLLPAGGCSLGSD